jgi:hypothetical protein
VPLREDDLARGWGVGVGEKNLACIGKKIPHQMTRISTRIIGFGKRVNKEKKRKEDLSLS